ncbi:MAG: hypothetical protein IJZ55_13955 [Lachnospiraceae bacterium]|nr:hypothetical protein [Lachnospiraceae bacterium]
MRKVNLKNNVFLVAREVQKDKKMLEYFLQLPDGTEEYVFSKNYSSACYGRCKSGVPVNEVLYGKMRNDAFMNLAKHLRIMMPYMVEYLGL